MHGQSIRPLFTQFGWYLAAPTGCGWVLRDDGALCRRLLEIRECFTDGPANMEYHCMTWLPHGHGLRDEFQIAERTNGFIHPPLPLPDNAISGCQWHLAQGTPQLFCNLSTPHARSRTMATSTNKILHAAGANKLCAINPASEHFGGGNIHNKHAIPQLQECQSWRSSFSHRRSFVYPSFRVCLDWAPSRSVLKRARWRTIVDLLHELRASRVQFLLTFDRFRKNTMKPFGTNRRSTEYTWGVILVPKLGPVFTSDSAPRPTSLQAWDKKLRLRRGRIGKACVQVAAGTSKARCARLSPLCDTSYQINYPLLDGVQRFEKPLPS